MALSRYRNFAIFKEKEGCYGYTYEVWTSSYDGRIRCFLAIFNTDEEAKPFCDTLILFSGKSEQYDCYTIDKALRLCRKEVTF